MFNATSLVHFVLDFFSTHAGVISGALLYIRDDFEEVEKSTVLQVLDSILAL